MRLTSLKFIRDCAEKPPSDPNPGARDKVLPPENKSLSAFFRRPFSSYRRLIFFLIPIMFAKLYSLMFAAAAAKSLVMSDSVRPHRQQPTRLLRPWILQANTGVGCHFLLQPVVCCLETIS